MAIQKKTLAEIQQAFAPAKKTQGGNYPYSNLNDILPILKTLGADYTLMLLETELIGEPKEIEVKYTKRVATKWQVMLKTTWEFTFTGPTEKIIRKITMVTAGSMDSLDKAVGSALTYARRYLLLQSFNANDGGEFDPENNDREIDEVKKAAGTTKKVVKKEVAKTENVEVEAVEMVESVEVVDEVPAEAVKENKAFDKFDPVESKKIADESEGEDIEDIDFGAIELGEMG